MEIQILFRVGGHPLLGFRGESVSFVFSAASFNMSKRYEKILIILSRFYGAQRGKTIEKIQQGGQIMGFPARKCMCKWGTVSPA
jgi:hypothetical protein